MENQIISTYQAPFGFRSGHLQSIYPSLFRKFDTSFYQRERILTADDDFLDLDWSRVKSDRLVIISHGLEGSSHRPYIVGMVRKVNNAGWDALAWNFRSCSGEPNRQLKFYHSGATADLDLVVSHAAASGQYREIYLVGFSMGGNLTLVFLGQKSKTINAPVKKAVVFSVPCDLKSSSERLARISNVIYMRRFLNQLHGKIRIKMSQFPGQISDTNYEQINSFKAFDDRYTAPIHGFKDAEDYWKQCSSKQFIPQIRVPVLIVNAANDPFLAPECFPVAEADANPYVSLEIPASGGHVGFVSLNKDGEYWSEQRTIEFLSQS